MLATLLLAATLSAETRFVASDWSTVSEAKCELEDRGAASLPFLMSLLDSDDVVKLTDTFDLIYPGATQFYGHGGVVDYDVDRIAMRAGWAIERLTFESFGFNEWVIRHEELVAHPSYPMDYHPTPEDLAAREKRRRAAIAAAKAWYAKNARHWRRFDGLKAALMSNDRNRQLVVLNWVRYGSTSCDGLTRRNFRREIVPLVQKLRGSDDPSIRQQAELVRGEPPVLQHPPDQLIRKFGCD
jgi:hypothetical protein